MVNVSKDYIKHLVSVVSVLCESYRPVRSNPVLPTRFLSLNVITQLDLLIKLTSTTNI